MTSPFVPSSQQSTLPAGKAMTWRFDRTAVLVVQKGRVWLTLDGDAAPHGTEPSAPRGGDWFLDAGMSLRLAPRQSVVLEAAGAAGEPAVLGVYAEAVALLRPAAWLAGRARRLLAGAAHLPRGAAAWVR